MKNIVIDQTQKELKHLIEQTNSTHEPILLTSPTGNAIILSEKEWQSLQETLYLQSIPGMVQSIQEGGATPLEHCLSEHEVSQILNG